MAGKRGQKRVTQETFDRVKVVIDNLPKHSKGLSAVYDALGISNNTASKIRKVKDFEGYQELNAKLHRKMTPVLSETPAPRIEDNTWKAGFKMVLEELDRIEAKLDRALEFQNVERELLEEMPEDDGMVSSLKRKLNIA